MTNIPNFGPIDHRQFIGFCHMTTENGVVNANKIRFGDLNKSDRDKLKKIASIEGNKMYYFSFTSSNSNKWTETKEITNHSLVYVVKIVMGPEKVPY